MIRKNIAPSLLPAHSASFRLYRAGRENLARDGRGGFLPPVRWLTIKHSKPKAHRRLSANACLFGFASSCRNPAAEGKPATVFLQFVQVLPAEHRLSVHLRPPRIEIGERLARIQIWCRRNDGIDGVPLSPV